MIRRATPSDVEALTALVLRALVALDVGGLVISGRKIEAEAKRLISDPSGFVLVNGEPINGAIALQVRDGFFFERKVAGIVFWYAETPRTGYAMLRQAVQWCSERPVIKVVGMSMDFGGDERIGTLLERVGLKCRGSVYAKN